MDSERRPNTIIHVISSCSSLHLYLSYYINLGCDSTMNDLHFSEAILVIHYIKTVKRLFLFNDDP